MDVQGQLSGKATKAFAYGPVRSPEEVISMSNTRFFYYLLVSLVNNLIISIDV